MRGVGLGFGLWGSEVVLFNLYIRCCFYGERVFVFGRGLRGVAGIVFLEFFLVRMVKVGLAVDGSFGRVFLLFCFCIVGEGF